MFGPQYEVTSSNIKTLQYDADTETVRVEFKNHKSGDTTATWDYSPISREGFDAWLAADSIGRYFISHVKGVVQGTKVSG